MNHSHNYEKHLVKFRPKLCEKKGLTLKELKSLMVCAVNFNWQNKGATVTQEINGYRVEIKITPTEGRKK